VIEKNHLSLWQKFISKHIMATPVRMAPVLYGKDAEYFYKVWAESRKQPDSSLPSKEKRAEIRAYIKSQKAFQ
jgi:hypothetical protein